MEYIYLKGLAGMANEQEVKEKKRGEGGNNDLTGVQIEQFHCIRSIIHITQNQNQLQLLPVNHL